MERIRTLSPYQKLLLLLITLMAVVFTILYPITISRVGYAYNGTILLPSQSQGSTVYYNEDGRVQSNTLRPLVGECWFSFSGTVPRS